MTPPAVSRASIAYGLALAAVYGSTGEELAKAKRTRRDAKYRLTQLVGVDAVAHFTASLEMDSGLLLRALHSAPASLREYTLAAALGCAQTALEHGLVGRAALVLLARSGVWQALSSAYLHASLIAGGDEALDKRGAHAGQQARLDLLAALDLGRSPILMPVRTAPVESSADRYKRTLAAAEKQLIDAGLYVPEDDDKAEDEPNK